MKWKIELYTMLLERAEELGNPKDIEYCQTKLQKAKVELQREKDIKALHRFLFVSWLVIFSSPFLIDFFGWY